MGSITILGWTSDDKVPGAYRETVFGTGRMSVGAFPVKVLITGTKLSTGSAVADQDIVPIRSADEADAKLGAHSTAKRQAIAALNIPGVNLYAAPPLAAGTAATMTLTVGGTWTTTGEVKLWIGGEYVAVAVGSTQVAADVGTSMIAQVNSLPDGLVLAAGTTPAITLTARNLGTQGNSVFVYWDLSEAPAGLTITASVGTMVHDRLYHLATGATTESVANIIALLKTDTFDYIAAAQNDAANLALFEAHMGSEAGPTIAHLEHMVAACTGTLVAASALSQTTLNDYRSTMLWYENCETHPSELAASVGAIRSVIEPDNPNFNYDDTPVPSAVPQRYAADKPLHATLKTALNSGLTPLYEKNGVVCIVRGIVTHCLNGSVPDYRCLDWGDAIVPDRISKELGVSWLAFKDANPYVGPDAVGSESDPPEGVGTPARWTSEVYGVMKKAETANWVQDVDTNLPETEYDNSRSALVCAVPNVTRKQQHSIGISVRGQAA